MKEKICPYPGLRPFAQEESIFFKGRDLHIRQVINQIEERKFIMITGASGDGKSSLVYAGVIPSAMAGFFHAEYNNWLFVDFKPERNPLNNLSSVVSDKLGIENNTVAGKLKYGFSSLISLYKSTDYYIDKESEDWKLADSYEKKKRKNKAANLFILADQFEEFFTNKENYNNGKPSNQAYTTVNLLLETARIAREQNLPVYVVFTMRSDFISQCVAFKGLPEFIGFSQFFIPRLKRNELQQVIEDPAFLSGGKISPRLVEVLINELGDGFDQLPVLQHNLNALWLLANNGDDELDLIHLVKLAGMDKKYLNSKDSKIFDDWFNNLYQYKKDFFKNISLANVLNSHANDLYLSAYKYFIENSEWTEKSISEEEAFFVIKTTFQSLTKIDEGRAVRNRMSLREITQIINKPNITPEIVCGVINVFRLPTSTFIKPFIDENDIATKYLSADSVWDITHEALIRNWELLQQWEEEEYQNLTNFKDFSTQLNRWLSNNKSAIFLLPAGTLGHFEKWYNNSNLNPYWIAKYDNSEITEEERLLKSETIAANSKEFITKSRKNIEQLEKSKKRQRFILAVSAIVIIAVLSGLTFWSFNQKSIADEQTQIAIEKTEKAKEEKERADEQKKIAEKNADAADVARLESDSARVESENMRKFADEKTKLALYEKEQARIEKEKAEKQTKIAKDQTEIANEEKEKSKVAEKESKRLSYLAIAQSVSFKAVQNYNDTQVNLLLSYFSYNLNKENEGDLENPSIFQALLSALDKSNINQTIYQSANNISQLTIPNGKNIESLTTNGFYSIVELSSKNKVAEKTIKSKVPIGNSFIFNNYILLSYDDYSLKLWNKQTEKTITIGEHTDYVRTAVMIESKNILITGGRDKKLIINSIKENSAEILKEFELSGRITQIVTNSNIAYVSCNSGDVFAINLVSYKQNIVNSSSKNITALCLTQNNEKLIIGYSNGSIKLISTKDYNNTTDYQIDQSKIDAISVSNDSKLLAIAMSSKLIKIYKLDNLESKPYVIDNLNQKIFKLYFLNNTQLFALLTNSELQKWDISNELLSMQVHRLITRNLTESEWKKHIGDEVKYIEIK